MVMKVREKVKYCGVEELEEAIMMLIMMDAKKNRDRKIW